MSSLAKHANPWLIISRPEFLPANSASLVIGLAWGLTFPVVDVFGGLVVPLILAFAVISLVGAFAAQMNTISDFEFDKSDGTKKELVTAMGAINRGHLKIVMASELTVSLVLLLALGFFESKVAFLALWVAAAFLAYAYSSVPLRFKSRSVASPITLMIVLSILPVTFATYVFTSTLDWVFWVFLAGQALTVYGVIVPAEIRDYFSDKASGTVTLTVRLGLVKATTLGLAFLAIGGTLCAFGFIVALAQTSLPYLGILLAVMVAAYVYVINKYWQLLRYARQLTGSHEQSSVESEVVDLASKNPKWITLVTQSILLMSIALLVAKLL